MWTRTRQDNKKSIKLPRRRVILANLMSVKSVNMRTSAHTALIFILHDQREYLRMYRGASSIGQTNGRPFGSNFRIMF